jgi:hypothetical protein
MDVQRITGDTYLTMKPNAETEARIRIIAGLCLLSVLLPPGCASSGGHGAPDAGAGGPGEAGQAVPLPPPLDPRAIGTFDLSKVTVAAFSQTGLSQSDPQVLTFAPDLVPRAFNQWDRSGLAATDYDFGYAAACRAKGTLFLGGLTASVIFVDQMSAGEFADEVSRNAAGEQVAHAEVVPGAFRGALASPGFRQMLIRIAEIQIDGGVDGVFFDEVNAGYSGASYNGNEGFDDHGVADFGRFLCARHGDDAAALSAFALVPKDGLDCTSADPGAAFDYRGYLARQGLQSAPLSAANPLATEWGTTVQNRPDPARGGFLETYTSLVYWQEIVVAVRSYAREKYGKEVLITANGIFPFVDFQSVGLYDWNKDGGGPRGFDYVPVTGTAPATHLDGTVSFMPVLQALKERSKRIVEAAGGHEVPLLLFLDWPTDNINRYYALPLAERQDYLRLFLAEAYAFGMWFALPMATTTDNNTATALGMMDFFATMRDFYRSHADLFHGGRDSGVAPAVSATGVAAHLVTFDSSRDGSRDSGRDGGRAVLHLVNHNYAAAFLPQTALSVTVPLAQAPTSVTLLSPDLAAPQPTTFSYASGQLSIDVGTLVSSMVVVIE